MSIVFLHIIASYTITTNPDKQFAVLIALLIAIIGPFAGTYMFMKNASKVFSAVSGGINKLGAGAQKWASGWASARRDRSTFSQMMNARKQATNVNAQQRAYTRMGKGLGKVVSGAGMFGNTKQLMETQIHDANDKILDSRVKYALQDVRKQYNAKDRDTPAGSKDPRTGQEGIEGLVRAAHGAAQRGDQVAFNAYAAHAASGGADEYKMFHEGLQAKLSPKSNPKYKKMFDSSMAYTYSTMAGELAPKSPGVVSTLQAADSRTSIQEHMEENYGLRKMYNKVGADKHAAFSSEQAKAAAKFATDDVLRELIENPGGKHSLGDGARKAYQEEYDRMLAGTREFGNGRPPEPPASATP